MCASHAGVALESGGRGAMAHIGKITIVLSEDEKELFWLNSFQLKHAKTHQTFTQHTCTMQSKNQI